MSIDPPRHEKRPPFLIHRQHPPYPSRILHDTAPPYSQDSPTANNHPPPPLDSHSPKDSWMQVRMEKSTLISKTRE